MTTEATLNRMDDESVRDFVSALYRIFLHREPDPIGLDNYVSRMQQGMSLTEIITVFSGSDELAERWRRSIILDLASRGQDGQNQGAWLSSVSKFPEDYAPPGEAGRSYGRRLRSGFLDRYCSGNLILDVGYTGYENPERKTALPGAIGIDLDYPGYDGLHLPFADGSVDTVFSSHCLEHILFDHAAIQDWYRVLKVGGFIVCMVPSQALYEKKRYLPSLYNADHKRMYTPSSIARAFEEALPVNSYRVRHLAENDEGFNYALGPEVHSDGAYEIEIVVEKIVRPNWDLA